jgi:hypothetical protein
MKAVYRHIPIGVALVAVSMGGSCSRFGGEKSTPSAVAAPSEPVSSQTDYEAKLLDAVQSYVRSQAGDASGAGSRLTRKTPYYFKEYSVYPDGADPLDVDVLESDLKTAPYRAQVKLNKQRFATKMHRKRDEAVADSNFLRDTGTETLSFELRGNRWHKVGSLFVAEKTEENVNGEWVPAQEEVERTVAAEEQQESWWTRAWSAISGR